MRGAGTRAGRPSPGRTARPPNREEMADDLARLRGVLLDLYRSADRKDRDGDILKAWGKIHDLEGRLQKPDNTLIVIVKETRSGPGLIVRYHEGSPMTRKLYPGTIAVLTLDGLSPLTYYPYPPRPDAGPPPFPAEPPPPPPGFGPPPPPKGARPVFSKQIKFQSNDQIIEFVFAGGKWTHKKICPPDPVPDGLSRRSRRVFTRPGVRVSSTVKGGSSCRYAITSARRSPTEGRGMGFTGSGPP